METKCAQKIGMSAHGDLWKQGSWGEACKTNKINGPVANTKPKGSKK